MTWQGIPFKYLDVEPLQQLFLNVSHIPDVVVKSGFALDTFLSGLCAGAIPAIVAIFAMRSNAKSIQEERKHQQQLSNKSITMQIVSASRQVLINDIRDAGAKYLGAVTSVINNTNSMAGEYRKNSITQTEHYYKALDSVLCSMNELGLLTTRLQLLLDPNEAASLRVHAAMSNIRGHILKDREDHETLGFEDVRVFSLELKDSIREVVRIEWKKINSIE